MRAILLISLSALMAVWPAGTAADEPLPNPSQEIGSGDNPQVNYAGFVELTQQLEIYRAGRLLSLEQFLAEIASPNALLLDTRSAAAFESGHIAGAVNLPFSDFTESSLREMIGEDKTRPIYIYCNNNFSDNRSPILLKRAPLALNIPTFINLYGYGYQNIWELDGVTSIAKVPWTGAATSPTELAAASD